MRNKWPAAAPLTAVALVTAACSSSSSPGSSSAGGTSSTQGVVRDGAEDRDDQRSVGPDHRRGLHPVPIRAVRGSRARLQPHLRRRRWLRILTAPCRGRRGHPRRAGLVAGDEQRAAVGRCTRRLPADALGSRPSGQPGGQRLPAASGASHPRGARTRVRRPPAPLSRLIRPHHSQARSRSDGPGPYCAATGYRQARHGMAAGNRAGAGLGVRRPAGRQVPGDRAGWQPPAGARFRRPGRA